MSMPPGQRTPSPDIAAGNLVCGATAPPPAGREAALARAEMRGKQVLLYAPDGPLGGSFMCSRCGANALQPVLLEHLADCPYSLSAPSAQPR